MQFRYFSLGPHHYIAVASYTVIVELRSGLLVATITLTKIEICNVASKGFVASSIDYLRFDSVRIGDAGSFREY